MTSRVKHDGDNDDSYDNDDDEADEKEDVINLSHHEMIGHVVSGADVVRLSIHVNTWLLPDFNHSITMKLTSMLVMTMVTVEA